MCVGAHSLPGFITDVPVLQITPFPQGARPYIHDTRSRADTFVRPTLAVREVVYPPGELQPPSDQTLCPAHIPAELLSQRSSVPCVDHDEGTRIPGLWKHPCRASKESCPLRDPLQVIP
ncbi:uncharacterized protein LOC144246223 isoform X2 [Lonchura striata]